MSAPTLRPYQQEGLEAIASTLLAGTNRQLLKMPTGTGKTVLFSELPKKLAGWLDQYPHGWRQMLVIAHREELLDQAAEKIAAANPGLMVSVEQGPRYANQYSDVVVASIQTLAAMEYRRLTRLQRRCTFRIVVVDEAHHAAADSYRAVLALLGFLPGVQTAEGFSSPAFDDAKVMAEALHDWDAIAPKDRLLLGVTATPNRSDAIGLGCVFQSLVMSYALRQAITDGWLVPIEPWVIETHTSLDGVHMSRGDFNQKELADAVNQAQRNKLAVTAWHEKAPGKPTIAFTVDVAHAHDLAAEFVTAGVRAMAVSGQTPKDDRRNILQQFRDRQIDVITNCMVLTEGTDLPLTECILHAKPTTSATLYEQMTGRGLRINPGKTKCVVLDLVDVARRHSLQAAPVLYGLPPGLKMAGEDLQKTAEELDALRAKGPNFDIDEMLKSGLYSLADLQARAVTFDLWTIPTLTGALREASGMDWLQFGSDRFQLSYPWADGQETLTVAKDLLGHWDVSCTLKVEGRPTTQRTLAMQVETVEVALRFAETFIRAERRTVANLTDATAKWKADAPSQGQINFLKKLRVPFNEATLTKGAASQLITMGLSRRR